MFETPLQYVLCRLVFIYNVLPSSALSIVLTSYNTISISELKLGFSR